MVYVPGRSATNDPSGKISAPGFCTDHEISAAMLPPFLSFAAKCTTSPVFALEVAGEISRLATDFLTTRTEASPVAPSPAARIFASPGLIACNRPAASTVAIEGFSEVQVRAIAVRGSPSALRGAAVRRCVAPAASGADGTETS